MQHDQIEFVFARFLYPFSNQNIWIQVAENLTLEPTVFSSILFTNCYCLEEEDEQNKLELSTALFLIIRIIIGRSDNNVYVMVCLLSSACILRADKNHKNNTAYTGVSVWLPSSFARRRPARTRSLAAAGRLALIFLSIFVFFFSFSTLFIPTPPPQTVVLRPLIVMEYAQVFHLFTKVLIRPGRLMIRLARTYENNNTRT